MVNNIKVENFNFWYGTKQILFDVNLEIKEKQITALIGPSGCGKSTLLRSINRMNDTIRGTKIKGDIQFNGIEVYNKDTEVTTLRKRVGMVFQKPNPFPMSIYENIAYGLRVQGVKNKKQIDQKVQESLERADLWDEVKERLNASAFGLSGGQQQRLCIARALAVDPEALLLDEPCSALDPISTAKIEQLLLKLKDKQTIIIVTHNMHQAKRVSDYTCYLLNGKIIEYSQTKKLFSKPQNKLTKEYINGDFG